MKDRLIEIWKNRRNRYAIIGAAAAVVCVLALLGASSLMHPAPVPPDDAGEGYQAEPEPPAPEPPEPEPEPEPLFSADELAALSERIDGSTATIPLTEAIYDFFGQGESAPQHKTTPFAYQSLIDREASLIFVTYPSEDEFGRAEEEGVKLEIVPVTKDALVFLVNIDNPVESVTTEQLRDIYTGRITNWSEVGGLDESIIPFQRTPNSGSQTLMLKLLMEGKEPMEPPEEYIQEQMGDLVDAVSAYDNSRAALGYSMFYYVNNMYGNNRFKLLAVDGVKPVRDTITKDEYPMGTGYYAVIRENERAGSVARRLIGWLLTDEGQAVAIKAGYIPLRPIEGALPDTDIDPVYLGDYTNSSGTGGTVWKGWDAREELVTNGVKKPLSAVFYDGFNYIDYINTHIADELQALGQLIPGVNLAKPVVSMPEAQDVEDRINDELQSWISGFRSDKEAIRQIEWRAKEVYERAEEGGWSDFNYIFEPYIGYWKNYITAFYSLSGDEGIGGAGPLMFSICFDIDTGERVNLAEKLPDNIDFSKASWVVTPIRQTEGGQIGGEAVSGSLVPAPGSVITNAVMWGSTMIIYVTEPDGGMLECFFSPEVF